MKKPTRLQYAVLMRTARAINPLLAFDAKVNYLPLVEGLKINNFKSRRPQIIAGVKKLIAGKTIAKDASVEHLAKMLDSFEHEPKAEKSWDESVSEPQHKAMEAAAHGESNIGIPKSVGEEFSHADKGKKFGDMIRDWAKDKGFGEEDFEALDKMHKDCMGAGDETAEESEDEMDDPDEPGDEGVIEEGAEEADDRSPDEVESGEEDREDKDEAERDAKDKAAKDKAARDRAAKDKGKGAMDRNRITQDDMNKAISSAVAGAEKRARLAAEAREFVAPYVGKVALALDSAEKILRSAAKAMQIEDAETVHPSALRQLIKLSGQTRAMANDAGQHLNFDMANDGGDAEDTGSFNKMFPDAARIGAV